ncbi:hypothetical protein SMF913_10686 [Streptomyces malaysiensis]|uniref:Uncharacterized protein n=1 Tax=Streptomyces malaysiensis TaxID=92644 RepID=A0A2J7Z301_STRMQ|nr:hypothetical protein SMF913_10686 [Streptomyces malaysiensis]
MTAATRPDTGRHRAVGDAASGGVDHVVVPMPRFVCAVGDVRPGGQGQAGDVHRALGRPPLALGGIRADALDLGGGDADTDSDVAPRVAGEGEGVHGFGDHDLSGEYVAAPSELMIA